MNLVIGSGSTTKLLSGKKTKGFAELLQNFVASDKPHWNSYASPIDALRTGAILEDRYSEILPEEFYCQIKFTSKEFDCLTSSIDFSKIIKGKIKDFEELKTIYFTEFIDKIEPLKELTKKDQISFLKKKFKSNYNQVQFQLLCTGLKSATLTFLLVESYNDDENLKRVINEKDVIKFKIERDPEVIEKISERARIFQSIKDTII